MELFKACVGNTEWSGRRACHAQGRSPGTPGEEPSMA